jgi:hypothetical protein
MKVLIFWPGCVLVTAGFISISRFLLRGPLGLRQLRVPGCAATPPRSPLFSFSPYNRSFTALHPQAFSLIASALNNRSLPPSLYRSLPRRSPFLLFQPRHCLPISLSQSYTEWLPPHLKPCTFYSLSLPSLRSSPDRLVFQTLTRVVQSSPPA